MDVAIFHDIFSSWHYAFYYSLTKTNTLFITCPTSCQLTIYYISTLYLMDQMTLQCPTTLKDIIPVGLIESLVSWGKEKSQRINTILQIDQNAML